MNSQYASKIRNLIINHPLGINEHIMAQGHRPTLASSEFLTNKEQGDWAENLVCTAINQAMPEFLAVKYGRDDSLSAGDEGFDEFYQDYQNELNTIGKKPDILIFHQKDFGERTITREDLKKTEIIQKALAALEVRSSSFSLVKYEESVRKQKEMTICECIKIRDSIFNITSLKNSLKEKMGLLYDELKVENPDFNNLYFRTPRFSQTENLIKLKGYLKILNCNIRKLHKRDFLSFTPKLEDFPFVNRWIQNFQVPHFYLQVFFDRAYIISFQDILEISSNPKLRKKEYFIEKDSRNQKKTTVKIDIAKGKKIIDAEIPKHKSIMKELERGRLLFYIKFEDGVGKLDVEKFKSEVLSNE